MNTFDLIVISAIATIFGTIILGAIFTYYRRLRFIENYSWPAGLLDKLSRQHPSLSQKEIGRISAALKQFFRAYLKSGRKPVSMPSQAADDLWHEFILYTRDYQTFCKRAFGQFLHHAPAAVLTPQQKLSNEGLRRVWTHACREENIDPRAALGLPLLFAIDADLRIPGGYRYAPDCEALRRAGVMGTQCGGDFVSISFDGTTDGLGDCGGGDGGDEGGCGGGGD